MSRSAVTLMLAASVLLPLAGRAQTTPARTSDGVSGISSASSSQGAAARRRAAVRRHAARAGVHTLPMESGPPTAPAAPASTATQRAVDQRLLEQQQRQSAQAARITDQQVQQAQKQKEKIDNEVRIQDAPGPAQTGVVPAAGAPLAPVNGNDRIQDAPGPAQTLPRPPAPAPSTPPQP